MILYVIGFLAQLFFSARLLLQWILSERAKKVVSPTIFWILSLVGSLLLMAYGWLRDDFSIILGQFISFYIYMWNLHIKGEWRKMPSVVRYIVGSIPFILVGIMAQDVNAVINKLFFNESIPLWLVIFGTVGQITFTLRFIYQWIYSMKREESILPLGFWLISVAGSAIIIAYAIIRKDPVLILGQATGFFVYIRNIFIQLKSNKHELHKATK
ncbi:MAG: lipid-A-disaccharide synthase N-terminal domain-containing protein [Marinifilaceae bacterium]